MVTTHFDETHSQPGSHHAVARLAGRTRWAAAAFDRILPRLLEELSDIPPAMFEKVHLRSIVRPLRDVIVEDVSGLLWILFGAGALVLLIACANVANLFLVRAEARHRELAVRTALGASRAAVLAQYLTEALILSVIGGAAALVLAALSIQMLSVLPEGISLPRMGEIALDARVIAFAIVITLLTAFVVSLIPMLRSRKIPLSAVPRTRAAQHVGRREQRSRNIPGGAGRAGARARRGSAHAAQLRTPEKRDARLRRRARADDAHRASRGEVSAGRGAITVLQ